MDTTTTTTTTKQQYHHHYHHTATATTNNSNNNNNNKKTTHQKHLLLVRFRCTSARFSSSSHIFIHLCSAFQPVYLLLSISEKSKRTNIYMHFAYIIYINKFSIVCLKKLNCFYCHETKGQNILSSLGVASLPPPKPDKIQPGCCSKRPAAIQVILSPNGNST